MDLEDLEIETFLALRREMYASPPPITEVLSKKGKNYMGVDRVKASTPYSVLCQFRDSREVVSPTESQREEITVEEFQSLATLNPAPPIILKSLDSATEPVHRA